jgi:3-deoxy-manno-octulosonate cytidylyltransferase (CMP-KDO synthetase)
MNDHFVIIVPARAGSTRLPNKPLAMINGKSLISRVIDLARSSEASDVYIATDNIDIKQHSESQGAQVVMTSSDHVSGMDRVAEAANILKLKTDTLIVNLQGDEPFMPLEILNSLPQCLSSATPIATACIKFKNKKQVNNKNEVKVVRSLSKKAMYFSRSPIPNEFTQDYDNYLKHLGIYAYTNQTLQELSRLKVSSNEQQEKLEQLRFLDNGFKIYVQDFECESPIGIDTPEDLIAANKFAEIHDSI